MYGESLRNDIELTVLCSHSLGFRNSQVIQTYRNLLYTGEAETGSVELL